MAISNPMLLAADAVRASFTPSTQQVRIGGPDEPAIVLSVEHARRIAFDILELIPALAASLDEETSASDEEITPHPFKSRTPYEPGDDRDIWCKDCEYHRDHQIHSAAAALVARTLRRDIVSEPKRIQRKRTKGWKMPANTVYVGRPTKWGNPFIVSSDPKRLEHYADYRKNVDLWTGWPQADASKALDAFRDMVAKRLSALDVQELRGKNLACWCRVGQPCHADVLLELANSASRTPGDQP